MLPFLSAVRGLSVENHSQNTYKNELYALFSGSGYATGFWSKHKAMILKRHKTHLCTLILLLSSWQDHLS